MTDRQSDTDTIIAALEILSQAIDSEDGVANAAIAEGAQRLRDMQRKVTEFRERTERAELKQRMAWKLVSMQDAELDRLHAEVDMLKRSRQMDANEANSREHILRAEVEALRIHLAFVERWANHHARKPKTTAEEALSVIQHYPPIVDITESYADGVVPETPNPFAEVEALRNLLRTVADAFEDWQELTPDAGREWCDRFSTYLRGTVIAQACFTPDEWADVQKWMTPNAAPTGAAGER